MAAAPSPSADAPRWRRAAAAGGRLALTLGFVALAGATGVTAHGMLSARAAQVDAPPAAPLTTVAPIPLHRIETVQIMRRFTGQFEAAQETALGFEEPGTVAEILVRDGDRVTAGTVLARLDTRLLEAERTRLQAARQALAAQAELARRTNDRQQALRATGHVSSQRVDETALQLVQLEASLAEVDAALTALLIRRDKAEMRAPFTGRVGSRRLDTGAVVSAGMPVLTLLEDGPARFRVGLDPDLAASLSEGQTVTITSGARSYRARLTERAPELDPATRSQIAVFALSGDSAPPSRAAGEVLLTQVLAAQGAWVPLSALRQGPRGTWLLLSVAPTAQPTVGAEAVEILHLDRDRAFVRGSFADGTLILPAGTHRVVPGEAVRLLPAEGF